MASDIIYSTQLINEDRIDADTNRHYPPAPSICGSRASYCLSTECLARAKCVRDGSPLECLSSMSALGKIKVIVYG